MKLGWAVRWFRHLTSVLTGDDGWVVAAKFIVGLLTLVAAALTSISIISNLESERTSDILRQVDHIETGLLSGNKWRQMAALRRLQVFALSYPPRLTLFHTNSTTPFNLAKEVLLEKFSQYKMSSPRKTVYFAHSASNVAQPLPYGSSSIEKALALKVLSRLGMAGWDREMPRYTEMPTGELPLKFTWVSSQAKVSDDTDIGVARIFEGINLASVELIGADFSCVSLTASSFNGATLSRIRFANSRMAAVTFVNAKLEFMNMSGALAKGADFTGARIAGLTTASPTIGNSENANLSEASGSCATGNTDLTLARFQNAQLYNSSFQHSDMQGAIFSNALLSNVNFGQANLVGVRFGHSSISEITFQAANLFGAVFDNARISDTIFKDANILLASFVAAHIADPATEKSLLEARLRGTNLFGAVSPIDPLFCAFLRKGAVFVSDTTGWEYKGGRSERNWLAYTTSEMRESVMKCNKHSNPISSTGP